MLETVLYVDDLDAAERFYGEVLGLELDSRQAGVFVFFRCGAGMLLLFEPGAAASGRRVPAHGAKGAGPRLLRRGRGARSMAGRST